MAMDKMTPGVASDGYLIIRDRGQVLLLPSQAELLPGDGSQKYVRGGGRDGGQPRAGAGIGFRAGGGGGNNEEDGAGIA